MAPHAETELGSVVFGSHVQQQLGAAPAPDGLVVADVVEHSLDGSVLPPPLARGGMDSLPRVILPSPEGRTHEAWASLCNFDLVDFKSLFKEECIDSLLGRLKGHMVTAIKMEH